MESSLSFPVGVFAKNQPHAVCIPYPAQGHINPMMSVAKLLHSRGFHVTFVNTEYNHRRLIRSRGPKSVAGLRDFRFETIPDGLPEDPELNATQDIPSLCVSTSRNCLGPFRDLLRKLDASGGVPNVSCIVSDGIMSFTLDASEEMGIPNVIFWTTSACGFMSYLHFQELVLRGLVPLKDAADLTNGYLDTPVDCVPGLNKMRLKDFPSFIRITNPEEVMFNFMFREASRASRASAIILNTFYKLEGQVLDAMAPILPPIFPIGPLSLLTHHLPSKSELASLRPSLWADTSCEEWLDSKNPRSVLYVNFGSITVVTKEQVLEFAWGLARSESNFLWVIRPDLVKGDHAILPEEFVAETKGRGLLANWCNQEAVLSHPSVGGFLTHCGWNSTLESISSGVPMICWPFFAEQQTNCRYVCAEWKNGVEIDENVRREEVERLVRELVMGGQNGGEMRERVLKLKESATEATEEGGPAFVNLDKLVEVLLSKIV